MTMDFNHLPFEVGQEAESKSFAVGFRSAWFHCKIKAASIQKGNIGYSLEFFDFPDEKVTWTKLYQKPPKSHVQSKPELMVRSSFPPCLRKSEQPDPIPASDVVVLADDDWQVGDLVDWWSDGCFWSARVTHLLGNDKLMVELPEPPIGEGKSYKAFCKDLRPSLNWSPEHGWTVPISRILGLGADSRRRRSVCSRWRRRSACSRWRRKLIGVLETEAVVRCKLAKVELFIAMEKLVRRKLGMGSALETLCGQSFGAKQHHMLGIHLQRAMLVLMLVAIPVVIVWTYTGQILLACGQDPEISAEAGLYALWLIPSIFAYGILQCLIRFLQAQNIVFPMMLSSGITTLLHILGCWLLVFKSGLGNKGAALAIALSYWTNVLLLALYVKYSPSCKSTWTGLSSEAFHDVLSFVRLAIPSSLMVCLEMWSFELLVLLSGILPNPKLETSALSICLNTAAMVFMVHYGLGAAVSTRVSNELGAGRPQAARLAVMVVVGLAVAEALIVGLIMILVRNIWGYAYSNEMEVVKYVAIMLPILATSNFFDGIQCVLSGTARGCGWQKIGAYVNLGAYYVVGIPSAILLAFVLHIGGKGLWMGIICGLLVQVLSLIIITIRTDWDKEATKARDSVHSSTIPTLKSDS